MLPRYQETPGNKHARPVANLTSQYGNILIHENVLKGCIKSNTVTV
jgi:hypothetical protein